MLTYDIKRRGEDPLYVFLYKCIKHDIETGVLQPHEKLPSKRSLAQNLGIGVITVEAAYAQLIAEGYLYTEPKRGYFVCNIEPLEGERSNPAQPLPSPTASAASTARNRPTPAPWLNAYANTQRRYATAPARSTASKPPRFDLSSGIVSAQSFPFSTWSKTLRDTIALEPKSALLAPADAQGNERLRRALAAHLASARSLAVDASNIVIAPNIDTLCGIIVQLSHNASSVAVADPERCATSSIYAGKGLRVDRIPLDHEGIDVARLDDTDASLLHIAPSGHFPTGIVTSAGRRRELLAWATDADNRFIIEDDRDAELRLAGAPVPPLQSIDAHERVIYMSALPSVFGDAVKLAFMVLPACLAQRYRQAQDMPSCSISTIEQIALARFIEEGELTRLVNRTKTRCRATRNTFINALKKTPAAAHLRFGETNAGPSCILSIDAAASSARRGNPGPARFNPAQAPNHKAPEASRPSEPTPEQAIENALVAAIARQDIAIKPLSAWRADATDFSAPWENAPTQARRITCRLVVAYAALPESQARAAAEALYRAIAPFL